MESDDVFHIHSMLHLIFHHNKNQHRRTKWWKWLSILTRTVWNLAMSLSTQHHKKQIEPSAEFYRQYLATRIIPRCYLAFSVVVADVQFSTLGTVLLATLARLSKVTGIDKELKYREWNETIPDANPTFHFEVSENQEDIGEAFARDGEASEIAPKMENHQKSERVRLDSRKPILNKSSVTQGGHISTSKKRKKSKKRDAIDDLFDGLL